jgi:DNA-binding transcriptional ArsR family regulator
MTASEHATDQLLAAQLKALGSPIRICILRTLLTHARGTLCVEDLRDEILLQGYDMVQPSLSYHIRELARARVIERDRRSRGNSTYNYYVVRHEVLVPLSALFGELVELAKQQTETRKDNT